MKIALVGVGKIALDQHVPSLAASPDWDLAATVSRNGSVPGVEAFADMAQMLAARPDIEVVSLCLPPVPRFDYAAMALAAGRHVMLEKPPGTTLSECHTLEALARQAGVALFASWHSRSAARVADAKRWLAGRSVRAARITWHEDVRKWHPGQDWCFEPGGMGVFDPGINALSVLTEILPIPVHLRAAQMAVPANRQAPIAAELQFTHGVTASFNWDHRGDDVWDISVETDDGALLLQNGGAQMSVNAEIWPAQAHDTGEYPGLYRQMAGLVAARGIDLDLSPMRHVADAFLLARRDVVDPFDWV